MQLYSVALQREKADRISSLGVEITDTVDIYRC